MEVAGRQQRDTLEGTKRQIVDVARRLFSDRSYLGVSMSDIAARIGITKATLYHHFTGKEDIYRTVLDDVLADLDKMRTERIIEMLKGKHQIFIATPNITNYSSFGLPEIDLKHELEKTDEA